MAKKASATSIAIRTHLQSLPAETFKDSTIEELLNVVKADKTISGSMKKLSMTDSSIKQLIQKVKAERGLVVTRKKKSDKATPPQLPYSETHAQSLSGIEESDEAESVIDAELTVEDSLKIIEQATKKFPQLSEAIKIAAVQRQRLIEQQRKLNSLFGE